MRRWSLRTVLLAHLWLAPLLAADWIERVVLVLAPDD